MLPTQLSNGICSLNEGEDRLAFSCLMRLDENGEIRSYKFVKSVICSRVKGVYKEINALLEPPESETDADLTDLKTKYEAVLDQLPTMDELYRKRLVLRKARGGMEIESNEAKLVMDENGRCIDIVKRDRGTSECMIEELCRWRTSAPPTRAARTRSRSSTACTQAPTREDGEAVRHAVGLRPERQVQEPHPDAARAGGPAGRDPRPAHPDPGPHRYPAQHAESSLLSGAERPLRPGAGRLCPLYQPIRRYPDLAIHRILTDMLVGKPEQELIKDYTGFATHASEQSSRQEVSAVRIERDVEDLYKAEYMHNHLVRSTPARWPASRPAASLSSWITRWRLCPRRAALQG